MEPLHPDGYDDLCDGDVVNTADVAALAGVAEDTAYRWTREPDWPPAVGADAAGRSTWNIARVLGWLCASERIDGCDTSVPLPVGRPGEMMTRAHVEAATGRTREALKMAVYRGTFPRPAGHVGRVPIWRRADVERWQAARRRPAGAVR